MSGQLDEYRIAYGAQPRCARGWTNSRIVSANAPTCSSWPASSVAELERAALVAGEDEELAAARTVLANAAKLAAAAHETEELLYGAEDAALDRVAHAQARLGEAAAIDPKLGAPLELIAAARASLDEAAHELRSYAERIEADPARLEQIDNRLAELNRLKRKYGGTIDAALETLARSRAEIANAGDVARKQGASRCRAEQPRSTRSAAIAKKLQRRNELAPPPS